jgi:thiol-disulfide isomerase/thioredoxin
MPFSVVLLLALTLPQGASPASKPDALALLTQVSQRYADAKSYHIEAVEERTSSNELHRDWQKMLMTAIVMPDRRYRYEGRSGFGSAIVVSDGTTQWRYHMIENRYTRVATAEYPAKNQVLLFEENAAFSAEGLAHKLAGEARRLKAARYLPDETISVDGRSIECYVIRYSSEDYKTRNSDHQEERTVWIEKTRRLVVKTFTRSEAEMMINSQVQVPVHEETTITYPVVKLDQKEPASSFNFVPPFGAELIAEFPNPFSKRTQFTGEDLEGKPAPEVQFKSADGQTIRLSGFRGKPVFLEFWATSCGPCVALLPDLAKLYAETQNQGLVWISVDNDQDPADVAAYLSKKQLSMPWPNYHDEDGSLGKAFHRFGIPLGVLIDKDGKITFYESGYEIDDLRSAIAKLGPQLTSVGSASASLK